jgi:FKBP-type peptidyl-prolyl cis-trans isomerase FklB
MDKLSYSLGLSIGHQLAQMGARSLNIDDFAQAIKDILAGEKPQVSDNEAQTLLQDFFEKKEEE